MVMVAKIEPTYQTVDVSASPFWAGVGVWINLYLFNLFQLVILKNSTLSQCIAAGSRII